MCRNCGSLIGAGETSCYVCGAQVAAAPSRVPLREGQAMNFVRAVLDRPHLFTIIFLIANLFVFMVMWEASGMKGTALWPGFSEAVLLAFGAKTDKLIHYGHEYWRFVTPVFIHVNL